MVSRLSAFQRCLFSACLSICLCTAACAPAVVAVTPAPTCTPLASAANPYLSNQVTSGVKSIYTNSFMNLASARQEALFQLGRNTEHWSAQVNLATDDAHMVRIVVTYLDPVLIQYIILNYLLNDPNYLTNVINTPMTVDGFDDALAKTLQSLGKRNEMLFLVTITAPFYRKQAYNGNVLTIKLPIDSLVLSSASNLQVTPTHKDRILAETIDITHGPVSGIVGYPIAVINQNQCVVIIDEWTNALTLDMPSLVLGDTLEKPQFWNIPYRSLIMQDNTHPTPTFDSNAWKPFQKLSEPPTPTWRPNAEFDETVWPIYWESMGRYIWNYVITESHQ